MLLAAIDWTNVLVALIAGLPAIIAAVGVLLVHGQIKTPSGRNIGAQVEWAAHTAKANNMLLATANGPTKEAAPEELSVTDTEHPQVPADVSSGG